MGVVRAPAGGRWRLQERGLVARYRMSCVHLKASRVSFQQRVKAWELKARIVGKSRLRCLSSVDATAHQRREAPPESGSAGRAVRCCRRWSARRRVCDVPVACARWLWASGAARDVLLTWCCALMVRPGGKVRQLVSNVANSGCAVRMRRLRCGRRAVRSGERRARRAVKNGAGTGEVAGAEGGYRRRSGTRRAAAARAEACEVGCKRGGVSSMRVRVGRAESSWTDSWSGN
jgi:hypothetical protein